MFSKIINMKGLLRNTGTLVLVVSLLGCTHKISFHELQYPLNDPPRTENALVVIDNQTLNKVVSVRSIATGAAHRWDVQPGIMLKQVADIEFPQFFNHYAYSNNVSNPTMDANTLRLVLTIPEYEFKNFHAYFTVKLSVFDQMNTNLLEKSYHEEGITQGSKMVWAGAFGMKSAIRQSSLDALKKIFKKIRFDLNHLLKQKPLPEYDDTYDYYSPNDSLDDDEYEYYSPQDTKNSSGSESSD